MISYDDFQADVRRRRGERWLGILAAEGRGRAPGRRPRDPEQERLLEALDRARLERRAAATRPSGDPGRPRHVSALSLCPESADDRDLLRRLCASTREAELALTDWSDEAKTAFVEQQFTAQHAYYREHYPEAAFDVVLLDGLPVGRFYVQRWPDEIRLIDVALLPEVRNRGLGGKLVADLLAEAQASGRRVTIHVEVFNPALRLYERLGFRKIDDRGPYQLMEWRPQPPGTAPR